MKMGRLFGTILDWRRSKMNIRERWDTVVPEVIQAICVLLVINFLPCELSPERARPFSQR